MSYILEALRKSEQERRRGSLPRFETPRSDTAGSRRVTVVMVTLLVVLVGLLAVMAWLYRAPIRQLLATGTVPASQPASDAATSVPQDRFGADPAAVVIDSTRIVEQVAGDEGAAGERLAARSTLQPVGADAAARPVSSLPDAMRERLPSYDISVISWSADPGRRFAMINGAIYREGDHLPEGPRVVAIESGRVVLTMLSETFFIVPRT